MQRRQQPQPQQKKQVREDQLVPLRKHIGSKASQMAPKKGADDPNAPRNHPCSKALKEPRDALNQIAPRCGAPPRYSIISCAGALRIFSVSFRFVRVKKKDGEEGTSLPSEGVRA